MALRRLPLPILPAGLNIDRSWRSGMLAQTSILAHCRPGSLYLLTGTFLPLGRQHSRDPGLSSIGEVCGPMRLNPEQLAVQYYYRDLQY